MNAATRSHTLGHRLMRPGLVPALLVIMLVSGCGTFAGNRLPQQTTTPSPMKGHFFVAERVSGDGITSAFGLSDEVIAPLIRDTIGPAVKYTEPLELKALIEAKMSYYRSQSAEMKKRLYLGIRRGATTVVYNETNNQTTLYADIYPITPEAMENEYKQFAIRKSQTELADKLRQDAKYRERFTASGWTFIDCETSVIEANASTVILEGLLCVCSLSLIPGHHTKEVTTHICVYDQTGQRLDRKYVDCWYNVTGLFLLPVGMMQHEHPHMKTIQAVLNNIAVTALLDYQRELGKTAY